MGKNMNNPFDPFMLCGPGSKKKRKLPILEFKLKTLVVNAEQTKLKVGMISGWTLTAIELWDDKEFLKKRIKEQTNYLVRLVGRRYELPPISEERFVQLRDAAYWQMNRYIKRLKELNSHVA